MLRFPVATAPLLSIAAFLLGALAIAQTPRATTQNLGLVGDRFKPLTYNAMTPAQKSMIDHLLAGERPNLGNNLLGKISIIEMCLFMESKNYGWSRLRVAIVTTSLVTNMASQAASHFAVA